MAKILAIESSCDETAISVIDDGKILCNIISSQIDTFKEYGGVVPEIASRLHMENFPVVIKKSLKESNIKIDEIDAVAVTNTPGLIGCLHVGLQTAKTISMIIDKPLIGVHHIAAHIYAANIDNEFKYPLLALVVSGGHTQLIEVKDELEFNIIGETLDDSIGEAYDKVARVLGLEYPGGPLVDKLAQKGSSTYELPTPKTDGEYDFSYSGIKSAVVNLVHNAKQKGQEINKEDLASSFQDVAIGQVINKTKKLIATNKYNQLVICGGVSANSKLRKEADNFEIETLVPKLEYCTDNAAMIAKVAEIKFKREEFGQEVKASPNGRL